MKTQGQLEAEIADAMTRFEKDFMGRGPTETRAYLLQDMVLVRLRGVLTPAEQRLISTDSAGEGRRLVKRMRTELLENAGDMLYAVIADISGRAVLSMHTDISTNTGERIILFMLDAPPEYEAR
ncbi:MAG: Na-translocating system protein MpsC family protein [Armatimonadota bacterium]